MKVLENLSLVLVLFFAWVSLAQAESFTLTHDQSGKTFTCSDGVDGPKNPGSISTCVKGVGETCTRIHGWNDPQCYSEAKEYCKGASPYLGQCVSETADYCVKVRGWRDNSCYTEAKEVCKTQGSPNNARINSIKKSPLLKRH
ncbi:MAG: hypothetical protein HYW85_04045 [Deltaproteobacteria bacterium]|nr:hypothetical protein [Deltaproteobacteria bacterium]MBI3017675.1 hypothetical protein [Deltaproteobacteria bacterium]